MTIEHCLWQRPRGYIRRQTLAVIYRGLGKTVLCRNHWSFTIRTGLGNRGGGGGGGAGGGEKAGALKAERRIISERRMIQYIPGGFL